MPNIKRANASGITKPGTAIADVPDAPTIGTATGGQAAATVTFTPATTGGTPTTYTATSTPGSITGTASSSPITISGLTNGTAYSFTVTATNSTGTSAASSASNQVTPESLGDMDPIAMVEVGSAGAANVTFSSIPQTYTHLQIRGIMRNTRTVDRVGSPAVQFNSDTGANYFYHRFYGDGSAAGADVPGSASTSIVGLGVATDLNTAGIFGVGIWDILDYANTNKFKTTRLLNGIDNNRTTDAGYISISSGLWRNTNAITSIKLFPNVNNWSQGTTFALYGIKGA